MKILKTFLKSSLLLGLGWGCGTIISNELDSKISKALELQKSNFVQCMELKEQVGESIQDSINLCLIIEKYGPQQPSSEQQPDNPLETTETI
jgi:hypothetical protein